jgi:hypothetical protein
VRQKKSVAEKCMQKNHSGRKSAMRKIAAEKCGRKSAVEKCSRKSERKIVAEKLW